MITIRKSAERGLARHGWLTSRHTFSFANYYDSSHMGYRDLRVINEDIVEPGEGFGAHRHDDMEIISIVMDGTLAHKDSTGGAGNLRRGEVQRMSAGSGVVHSEFNGSTTEPVHFFQIWIMPAKEKVTPGYEQKLFPLEERHGKLALLVSPDGDHGSLTINQDAKLFGAILSSGEKVEHHLAADRGAWIQVARGSITLNGTRLDQGDGAAIEKESVLAIEATGEEAEIFLFDLP
jgi:redox-sensitive bicupin YhaK (pirin superfamily)